MMTDRADTGTNDQAEHPPVTYQQAATRYGPGTHDARERYEELSLREHLSRA